MKSDLMSGYCVMAITVKNYDMSMPTISALDIASLFIPFVFPLLQQLKYFI
jgi:hypothetical protein